MSGGSRRRDCVPCSSPAGSPGRSTLGPGRGLAPLRAASATSSSSRTALRVHWLVHHFRSGARARTAPWRTAGCADVVVPEHHRTGGAGGHLPDDLVDRAIADGPRPVEERDGTVVAAVGTSPRRDGDGLPVAPSLDEVPARGRHAGQGSLPGRDVDRGQVAPGRRRPAGGARCPRPRPPRRHRRDAPPPRGARWRAVRPGPPARPRRGTPGPDVGVESRGRRAVIPTRSAGRRTAPARRSRPCAGPRARAA
jgi:hypothetical protein